MNKGFLKILRECCENKSIIGMYIKPDSDKFNVGILLGISEETYVYASIDTAGRMDGIRMGLTDDISRIIDDGDYIDKIKRIARIMGRNMDYSEYERHFNSDNCDVFSVLDFAHKNGRIVSVDIDNTGDYLFTGWVSGFDEDIVRIKEIDRYGVYLDDHILDIGSINFISCNSEDEKIIELLYRDRQKDNS